MSSDRSRAFDLSEGMSRLLESRRQDRMKEINLKVSLPGKRKETEPHGSVLVGIDDPELIRQFQSYGS